MRWLDQANHKFQRTQVFQKKEVTVEAVTASTVTSFFEKQKFAYISMNPLFWEK